MRGEPAERDLTELQERMLFAEALESVRCLSEGVLNTVADANIGSIWASAFRPGPAACCSTSTATRAPPAPACRVSWPAPSSWPSGTATRFSPPELLAKKAENGEVF